MKHLFNCLCVCLLLWVTSCTKQPTEFDIAGQWGVYDVTYIYEDSEPTHLEFTNNYYCEYWTFQVNGVLAVKRNLQEHIDYGDYFYNANNRTLKYIYEGFKNYINADVAIVSPLEMIITAHFNFGGTTIYKMKKLSW